MLIAFLFFSMGARRRRMSPHGTRPSMQFGIAERTNFRNSRKTSRHLGPPLQRLQSPRCGRPTFHVQARVAISRAAAASAEPSLFRARFPGSSPRRGILHPQPALVALKAQAVSRLKWRAACPERAAPGSREVAVVVAAAARNVSTMMISAEVAAAVGNVSMISAEEVDGRQKPLFFCVYRWPCAGHRRISNRVYTSIALALTSTRTLLDRNIPTRRSSRWVLALSWLHGRYQHDDRHPSAFRTTTASFDARPN